LHRLSIEGKPVDLPVSPEEYAKRRTRYRKSGDREAAEDGGSGAGS
jgi:hypothetical protein